MSVGTHLAVVVAFLIGATPRYQRSGGPPGVRDLAEAITFDLVPPVQAAPAPEPALAVEPRVIPRRGHCVRHARPVQGSVPVRMAANPGPLEPPPFEETTGDEEAAEAGEGAMGGAPAPPPSEPIAIPAGEAGYLRTYEAYPSLPRSLWVWGRVYSVLAQVCVSAQGQVSDVAIKRGAAPELDRAVAVAMRSWRYRPRLVEGAPRPFCHLMKLDFSLR
jgi:TonB family protein